MFVAVKDNLVATGQGSLPDVARHARQPVFVARASEPAVVVVDEGKFPGLPIVIFEDNVGTRVAFSDAQLWKERENPLIPGDQDACLVATRLACIVRAQCFPDGSLGHGIEALANGERVSAAMMSR